MRSVDTPYHPAASPSSFVPPPPHLMSPCVQPAGASAVQVQASKPHCAKGARAHNQDAGRCRTISGRCLISPRWSEDNLLQNLDSRTCTWTLSKGECTRNATLLLKLSLCKFRQCQQRWAALEADFTSAFPPARFNRSRARARTTNFNARNFLITSMLLNCVMLAVVCVLIFTSYLDGRALTNTNGLAFVFPGCRLTHARNKVLNKLD